MTQEGSIRKKGNRHYVVTRYVDPATGKTRQLSHGGHKTVKDAKATLRRVLHEMENGTYAAPDKITLGTFLAERWLPTLPATGIKPTTVLGYELHVRRYLVPTLGSIPLQKLTTAQVEALYSQLLAGGGATGKPLSTGSVRKTHATLTKSLSTAMRWGMLAKNPAATAKPPSQRAGRPEMKVWSAEEVRAFLEHVRDERLYALWALGFARGMRRGELLGLRWQDVDFDNGRLSVRQALVQVGYRMEVSTPKTAKGTRTIPLDATTLAALRSWAAKQKEERLAWGPAWRDTGLVFTRENGAPIHPDTASQWFERHARAARLPRIRLHDIRHTAATLLLAAGVPVKVVSTWLGHANIGITLDTYAHVIPAQEHAASDTMAALIFGSGS